MVKVACFLSLGLVLSGLFPSASRGAVPSAAMSTTPDAITLSVGAPFGGNPIGTYSCTILDAAGVPCVGIGVEIIFPAGADDLVAWAPGQDFTQTTNGSGVATFTLEGGGCILAAAFGGTVAEIWAGGVWMDNAYIISPDAVNSLGQLPTAIGDDICEAGGQTRVGLSDVVFFTDAIRLSQVFPCAKFATPYTSPVGLSDVVFLTPYMRTGRVGSCAP